MSENFCTECGKQFDDDAKFCSNCGAARKPGNVAERLPGIHLKESEIRVPYATITNEQSERYASTTARYAPDSPEVQFANLPFDPSRIPQDGDMIPADCVWAAVRHPGPAPAGAQYGAIDKRFVGLQTLQGRTYKEIVDIVGAPMTNNKHPESGHRIAIWGKTGLFNIWQVGLQFDRYDVCLGIFSEFNA